MRVLGLDPSLTNFGWSLHDDEAAGPSRCLRRGLFKTSSKTLYIDRYIEQRERLIALVHELKPDAVGLEFPVFDQLYSEGMYGLFLFTSEALRIMRQDVVFWSPGQIKQHAWESLRRPPGWKMDKPDMVEAARDDAGNTGRWNHNEADAYLCARLSARFWRFFNGSIQESDLTTTEAKLFASVKTITRGKRAGLTIHKGVAYRENERFFRWSEDVPGDDDNAQEEDPP